MQSVCRNYGSARGCRYGDNCYFSHDHPEQIQLCSFYLNNRCKSGNFCHYRHTTLTSTMNKTSKKKKKKLPTIAIELSLQLKIRYHPNKSSGKHSVQFEASWSKTDKRQKNQQYATSEAKQLLSKLKNNAGHALLADIGLFVQKKSKYTNNEWDKWLKKGNDKYEKLSRDEQMKIIIKIHELINFYNGNYKYLFKTFESWTYYRAKIIVNGYLNNVSRKLDKNHPNEILAMIFKFYFSDKYKLFECTNSVKISEDNTIIQSKRVTNDEPVCIPFIIYKLRQYNFLKIRIIKLAQTTVFGIGIIDNGNWYHPDGIKQLNDRITPFKKLEGETYVFYFGKEEKCKEYMNKCDRYCGELNEGDILELEGMDVYYYQSCVSLMVNGFQMRHKIDVQPKNKWDVKPVMVFDYVPENKTVIHVLNVECKAEICRKRIWYR
eukprot:112251_1